MHYLCLKSHSHENIIHSKNKYIYLRHNISKTRDTFRRTLKTQKGKCRSHKTRDTANSQNAKGTMQIAQDTANSQSTKETVQTRFSRLRNICRWRYHRM